MVEPHLVDLAYRKGLPLVATNEPFFPKREDYEAHDALICIAEGAVIADDKRRRLTPEQRAALVVHHFLGLPDAEAATVLDIALGTFKSRLHRASAAMRAAVEADERAPAAVRESIA